MKWSERFRAQKRTPDEKWHRMDPTLMKDQRIVQSFRGRNGSISEKRTEQKIEQDHYHTEFSPRQFNCQIN
jgi:hypothetical protein